MKTFSHRSGAKAAILSFTLFLIAAGLFGMGSQAALYTLAEDLVDKMTAWSKECAGKTDADCSRNLAALRNTAFKAAEWPQELAGELAAMPLEPSADPQINRSRAEWRLFERLFRYHGECFNRYDTKECRAKWAAYDKEEQRFRSLNGEPKRWWGFPDALKHRVFQPIPTKHIGKEMAKHWSRVPNSDVEIYSDVPDAKARDRDYVSNPNLPPDCVEIAPNAKLEAGNDFWTEPPPNKPLNVPDSCVLVKLYQNGKVIGWIYMEKSDVERLHMANGPN